MRILIVEDEGTIADTVVYALRSDGFDTEHVTTGAAALAAWHAHLPDLVVLDVGLPDMSGFDVCRRIRRSSDVPIIFLTARGDEIDRVVGLEIGADDYVVKPFSPRELAVRVRLRVRREPASAAASSARDFEVDQARARITFRGRALGLSRYEFRVLAILVAAPGRVYSREQLLELAWDHPEDALDRTVDTHIKTLRAKLRALAPGEELIRTHRGVGYALRG